jgi:hypothetical protein
MLDPLGRTTRSPPTQCPFSNRWFLTSFSPLVTNAAHEFVGQREIAAIDRELADLNAALPQVIGRPEEEIVRDARAGLLRVIDIEKLGRLYR